MTKLSNISTTLPIQNSCARSLIEAHDGTRLFYQDWGTGKPVVFVHGWGLGAAMWEYQMLALSNQGLRCIAYDKRGCGRSEQPSYGYDFDTFADDLASLIEQLDLQEVTLVGFSAGGGDVARYLSRHGGVGAASQNENRVAKTVLISSITPYILKTDDNPDGVDQSIFDAMIMALEHDRPQYLTASAPSFFGAALPTVSISPELIQWGIELALQASPKATIEMVRAFFKTDFRPDMRAFTMPTLIIHGDQDQNHPIAITGQKTVQAIPGCQFKVYEGAAHGLFVTHKEQLNIDLLAFIQSE